ncbi:MAG: hypothetical protein WKF84_05485 [Pyrinomonadaceae bacterium]
MILNGYQPSEVLLFGEHQWTHAARKLFNDALPFAKVIPTNELLSKVESLGGPQLSDITRHYWFVMKAVVGLLYPPNEFCLMDDDVFILDPVDDALSAFEKCDLAYAPDFNHGKAYRATWGWINESSTVERNGTFNAGLYWMRNNYDPRRVASLLLRVPPGETEAHHWEQGFIATLFTPNKTIQLPMQRYFYPFFDGLPGGMLGYDYALNPVNS